MTGKPLFRQKLENLPGRMPAMAADLQLQARALGDRTRYRLFRYIADAQGPVTVAESTPGPGGSGRCLIRPSW